MTAPLNYAAMRSGKGRPIGCGLSWAELDQIERNR